MGRAAEKPDGKRKARERDSGPWERREKKRIKFFSISLTFLIKGRLPRKKPVRTFVKAGNKVKVLCRTALRPHRPVPHAHPGLRPAPYARCPQRGTARQRLAYCRRDSYTISRSPKYSASRHESLPPSASTAASCATRSSFDTLGSTGTKNQRTSPTTMS